MEKPVLKIYATKAGAVYLKEVLAGAEEEGIPYEVEIHLEAKAKDLAYKAAVASILETGIGIDGEFACIAISKLPNKPLESYEVFSKAKLRLAGCNAARIVKGIPLKY